MQTINYNKLVRDKIPEIIQKDGKEAQIERVKGERLIELLKKKLDEELEEYKESGDIEELVDLVEVVYGILHHSGVTLTEFETIRGDKNKEKGSFEDGIVLLQVRDGR